MDEIDTFILALVKDADHPMTVPEVHQKINEGCCDCTYNRAYKRLMSLVAYNFLDVKKSEGPGMPKLEFSLVTA